MAEREGFAKNLYEHCGGYNKHGYVPVNADSDIHASESQPSFCTQPGPPNVTSER